MLLVTVVIEVFAKHPQISANRLSVVNHALRGHRVAHNNWPPRAHDARLFTANGFTVVAQNRRMVDIDTGDDGAIGIHHIRRIQAATQPHFQDHYIQLGQTQHAHDGQRGELEIRQQYLFTLEARGFDCGEVRQKLFGFRNLTMKSATLFKVHQVWRGVDPGL